MDLQRQKYNCCKYHFGGKKEIGFPESSGKFENTF